MSEWDHSSVAQDGYDSPWKEAIEHYFPEFMQFYFPEAYGQIDWSQGYSFLDQELRQVVQDAELGKRFVDKLVKVLLRDGEEKWIYVHIEVQGTQQAEFAKRMFTYNYRIFDKYDRPVASMAVLADEHPNWKPDHFSYSVLGCRHILEFPVAKVLDYQDRIEELLASDNPFAMVTAAHILTQQTRKDHQHRYRSKLRLVRLLYQRGWDKQRIIDLFRVIDWLMRLPKDLEQQLWHEIETIEEKQKMQYVTSVERFIIDKERQAAKVEGVLMGEAEMLATALQHRFGDNIADTISQRLQQADETQLKNWLIRSFSATTLEDVFGNSTH